MGRNVVIFGVDISNSKHANNKIKNMLVLGRGFIQKIDDTTIYAEQMYAPNFSAENKTFCLSLHYNGDNSYLFVNGKKVIQFKAKDSEIKAYPLILGNIAVDADGDDTSNFTYQTDAGRYGNVYDFSVDCDGITNDKIQEIHDYLMGKNDLI